MLSLLSLNCRSLNNVFSFEVSVLITYRLEILPLNVRYLHEKFTYINAKQGHRKGNNFSKLPAPKQDSRVRGQAENTDRSSCALKIFW